MKIKDRPEYSAKAKPLTCVETSSIFDASKLMAKMNYGSIIVTDADSKVLGLVTERDILKRVVAEGIDYKSTAVASVMSRDIKVAKAEDDVRDWLRIMSNERFRRLPIVDKDDRLVSVMTQGDFVSYTWPTLFSQAGDLVIQGAELTKKSMVKNSQLTLLIIGFIVYATISSIFIGISLN